MTVNISTLAPFIWALAAVLLLIGTVVVVRFFWHHVLRFVVQAGMVLLAIAFVLALLHYFKIF